MLKAARKKSKMMKTFYSIKTMKMKVTRICKLITYKYKYQIKIQNQLRRQIQTMRIP